MSFLYWKHDSNKYNKPVYRTEHGTVMVLISLARNNPHSFHKFCILHKSDPHLPH